MSSTTLARQLRLDLPYMRGKDVLAVQGRLSKQIAATLRVNGVFDHRTREAVRSYQQARKNLTPDGIVGRETWESLFGTTTDAFMIGRRSTEPPWLAIARQELGVKEIDSVGSNPRIEEYFETTSLGRRDDGVPWCAAFVSFCLTRSGIPSIRSARAADWLKWGNRRHSRASAALSCWSQWRKEAPAMLASTSARLTVMFRYSAATRAIKSKSAIIRNPRCMRKVIAGWKSGETPWYKVRDVLSIHLEIHERRA